MTNISSSSLLSLLFVLFFTLISNFVQAVPAYPYPIDHEQPNGQTITIELKGDEKVNWAETPDGYTILINKQGEYQYAIRNEAGDLVFSGVPVSSSANKSTEETNLLDTLPKKLFFSKPQLDQFRSVWEIKEKNSLKAFPTTGEGTLLCILMETPDIPFTRDQEEFDALFNQINYTVDNATGSVKDYYLENSYGQLNLTVDVVGPFTASENMEFYADDARPLFTEGIELADPYVNYNEYDNDNDGWVDAIYMIFSGYGQEAGGGPNTIWSHAWGVWPPVVYDGQNISRYACSPELRGNADNNPQGNLSRIGVIAHEFGHALGAPDYYDTNYDTDGQFQGTGRWDMMSGGAWNNWGATPAHHNGFTKVYFYNWADDIVLNEPAEITLSNAVENTNSFYRINTATPGEFFFFENRYQHHFDQWIPGSGMLIYHVHSDVFEASQNNTINIQHPQLMYPVSANAVMNPTSSPSSYGDINAADAAWTGNNGKDEFTDESLPGMINWEGSPTNKPITGISRNLNEKTVSFFFLEDQMPRYTISFQVEDEQGMPLQNAKISLLPFEEEPVRRTNPFHHNQSYAALTGSALPKTQLTRAEKAPVPAPKTGEEENWIHWDSGENHTAVGLTNGGFFTAVSRWEPADIEDLEGKSIQKLMLYVADLPLSAIAKVWQGADENNLNLLTYQEFTPLEDQWNEVILDEPVLLDTSKELWFGYELEDQGDGYFSAGRDTINEVEGKGNLLKIGNGDWVSLNDYDIPGNWNIHAYIDTVVIEPTVLYTDANGNASYETPSENYSWKVEKAGYFSQEGEVFVDQNDESIELVLVENENFDMVTLNVNMTYAEGFDPANHKVFVTGSFTDWAEPGTQESYELTLSPDKEQEIIIYTATFPAEKGEHEYKYFTDALGSGWDGAEWEEEYNRSFTLDSDTIIEDYFAYDQTPELYTLSLETTPEDSGTHTGEGVYPHNAKASITATGTNEYNFLRWQNGDTVVSNLPEFKFPMPQSNTTLTAYFTDQPPVIYLSENSVEENLIAGENMIKEFIIENHGDPVLNYTIESDNSTRWFEVEPLNGSVAKNQKDTIDLLLNAEKLTQGTYETYITIHSNDSQNPQIEIPVTIYVSGSPVVELSAETLDFGLTQTDSLFSIPLTIRNSGTADLEIWDVQINDNSFGYSSTEMSISPNASDEMDITFFSNQPGEFEAILSFSTNDANNPELLVSLKADIKVYELSVVVEPQGAGSVSGDGFFEAGNIASLSAQANVDFIFSNWSLNGLIVSTLSSYEHLMPAEDVILIANFETSTSAPVHAQEAELSIYPNPVKNILNIKSDSEIKSISISDISGKVLYVKDSDSTRRISIPVNYLQEGILIVKIITEEKIYHRKIHLL